MLKTKLIHPEILQALGSNGHGAKVLISDGNYPATTGAPQTAKKVFLNLAPGMLSVIDVLKVISEAIPVESALVMTPPDGEEQPVYREFKEILGAGIPLVSTKRFEFYAEVKSPDTCMVIATGEIRRFANILLTIGVVKYE
ncbi:MAG TPA: RbsD or FucU transport [Mariniphaga anaerophila]|uniref:RbsD or FucU transport n=1 Tax=Mariniphaga anaerophila TaxID=1484053 RepID=A0A831LPK2_9BACT|nr:RbsD or FucU transport [Mariniphaga anaerophila]